jgi:hypothetical protein
MMVKYQDEEEEMQNNNKDGCVITMMVQYQEISSDLAMMGQYKVI